MSVRAAAAVAGAAFCAAAGGNEASNYHFHHIVGKGCHEEFFLDQNHDRCSGGKEQFGVPTRQKRHLRPMATAAL